MTEPPVKPSVSVKARAREIDARSAADVSPVRLVGKPWGSRKRLGLMRADSEPVRPSDESPCVLCKKELCVCGKTDEEGGCVVKIDSSGAFDAASGELTTTGSATKAVHHNTTKHLARPTCERTARSSSLSAVVNVLSHKDYFEHIAAKSQDQTPQFRTSCLLHVNTEDSTGSEKPDEGVPEGHPEQRGSGDEAATVTISESVEGASKAEASWNRGAIFGETPPEPFFNKLPTPVHSEIPGGDPGKGDSKRIASPLDGILNSLEKICTDFDAHKASGTEGQRATDAAPERELAQAVDNLLSSLNVSSDQVKSCVHKVFPTVVDAVREACGDATKDDENSQSPDTGASVSGDGSGSRQQSRSFIMDGSSFSTFTSNKGPKFSFTPNLQVTTLTKVPAPLPTSVSQPTSPLSSRALVRTKPDLPSYLTLGRRPFSQKNVDFTQKEAPPGNNVADEAEALELEKIKSILASLDFSKYRKRSSAESLCFSSSRAEEDIPKVFQRSFSTSFTPSAAMEKSSSSSLRASAQSNKLKELTEKLKSPTSPPENRDDDSDILKKMPPVCRSSSFSKVDITSDGSVVLISPSDSRHKVDQISSLRGSVTLPRKLKQFPISSEIRKPEMSSAPDYTSVVSEDMTVSNISVDSAVESVIDEGLGADQDPTNRMPSTSDPTFIGKPVQNKSTKLYKFEIVHDDGTKGPNPPQPPEKRKRRKGFSSPGTGFQSSAGEQGKSNNNRSLTYPPQRKSSLSEEEFEFSSVDSNRLKSLKMGGNLAQETHCQASDLSLADSHFCPSEAMSEETYQDVVESIANVPVERNSSEERSEKVFKKKHYSDPSGDKNNGNSVEFPELISASKSEPELGEPKEGSAEESKLEIKEISEGRNSPPSVPIIPQHKRQHSGPAAMPSSSPVALYPRVAFSDSEKCPSDSDKVSSRSPQQQRRYSKKRLRGPYGEMLEEEMRKSGEKQKPSFCDDLSFLQELCDDKPDRSSTKQPQENQQQALLQHQPPQVHHPGATESRSRPAHLSNSLSLDDTQLKSTSSLSAADANVPKRKISANFPLTGAETESPQFLLSPPLVLSTSSAPSLIHRESDFTPGDKSRGVKWLHDKDAGDAAHHFLETPEISLARKQSLRRHQDTRTHVVGELYDTEKSYVESLQILVNKYMKPLKSPEYSNLVDCGLVDEIFFQIPEILSHHESFLDVLRQRLATWDSKQKVGDVFVEAFTKQHVIDTYTAFINNWKSAKEAIKMATQAKPTLAKFLEHMAREHKGKLTLDALLIMPVQRIPRYELLIKELIKHTQVDHPDHQLLVVAQKEVHDLALKINRMEREAFQHEQMQQKVKEIELLIDGVMDLVQPDRIFIRYDFVTIPGGLGTRKERCLFLFSDLLLITGIKKKSGTMRKTSPSSSSPSAFGFTTFDMNKYKLLLRFSLDNLDIVKSSDVSVKKVIREVENLEEDVQLLNQISELVSNLNCHHQMLDEAIKETMSSISRQLQERQSYDLHLLNLQLSVTTQEGVDNITIMFSSPEKRSSWEHAFNEAKQRLALSTDRRPPPEFMYPLPIRKTRAGLQFTCAIATLGLNQFGMRDVWVCNSDGYVGQVCVLSLQPEPTVTSCNGVCNARILCIASIPAASPLLMCLSRRKSVVTEFSSSFNVDPEIEKDDVQAQSTNGNIQLDSDTSEEEDEQEEEDEEQNESQEDDHQNPTSVSSKDDSDDTDNHHPTMWLGTEDGCIHVYNCSDNIRIKKNKMKVQHCAAVHCIIYLDNRVFVSLASGEIAVYKRDPNGGWNTSEPQKVEVGSTTAPVLRMLAVAGKLWCGCQNYIKVLNTTTFDVEHTFQVSSDSSRTVLCMVTSGLGVWLAIQHSAVIRLYHATTYEYLQDVNIAPAVTKMLSACDDIIRQHKAACLRVTALLACKDLLWVGTSAGVLLTLPLPHLTSSTTRLDTVPNVAGIPHGHTGHVRFLTCVEIMPSDSSGCSKYLHRSLRSKDSGLAARRSSTTPAAGCRMLVISGGDGYEDFRNTGLSEAAGRDDSTNHLLLWQV